MSGQAQRDPQRRALRFVYHQAGRGHQRLGAAQEVISSEAPRQGLGEALDGSDQRARARGVLEGQQPPPGGRSIRAISATAAPSSGIVHKARVTTTESKRTYSVNQELAGAR